MASTRSKAGGFTMFTLAALAAIYLARYGWLGLMVGLVLGWTGHLMWSWGWLEFLNEPSPWRALRWELANFRNIVLGNRRDSWDTLYEAGDYGQLVATAPEPRHYLIAGITRNRFPEGFRMLDAGCGPGVMYPLIAGPRVSYVGIDVIDKIIQDCQKRFSGDERCEFKTCGLEEYQAAEKFDVIVMTELLYYLPIESIDGLFHRAQSFLRNDASIIIVSMGGKANVGIRKIWRRLSALSTEAQSISVIDPDSGNIKTLKVYSLR